MGGSFIQRANVTDRDEDFYCDLLYDMIVDDSIYDTF